MYRRRFTLLQTAMDSWKFQILSSVLYSTVVPIRQKFRQRCLLLATVMSVWFSGGDVAAQAIRQEVPEAEVLALNGPIEGITLPQAKVKTEPEYSEAARDAQVQGTTVIQIVIDTDGLAKNIDVLSPVGYGLDEKAIEAIRDWRFEPAKLHGKHVPLRAIIEVNFRLPDIYFDKKKEAQRTHYNSAVKRLTGTPKDRRSAVETIRKLSEDKYRPASTTYGLFLMEGKLVPKDEEKALGLLRSAAKSGDGNAIAYLALAVMDGQITGDKNRAIRDVREASVMGSILAQLWLGRAHLTGTHVEKDQDRAKRQFRLCAARKNAECQLLLGQTMLNGATNREQSGLREHAYLQALAWLSLAKTAGQKEADTLLEPHLSQLDDKQKAWVRRLEGQLIRQN